jgi:alginate O-acetyltransferase complex protein AlgI
MLFNSIGFAIFLPIVFILYWGLAKKDLKFQNILLLVASYFFYACWDWRFLFLLIFSTVLDYYTGIRMAEAGDKSKKKKWFWLSVIVNLGFLGVFKYYNFFAASFAAAFSKLGLHIDPWTLKVILPVGISFYTFHGLSYVIDIYKDRIKPEKNFVDYSVFVSFFPLLVAGPIERATHLLPQIKVQRNFDYLKAVSGLRQILWGLFKKVVIADQCAAFANTMFNDSTDQSGYSLLLGAFFFTFQIYGDFSGYSDIAIGTAKLFGIDLLRNFAYPYFSRDIAEFWRRWHISLSSWFRDYLYFPLGGSRGSQWTKIRNVFIIFIVSGFWHGANWTFIVWGLLNAIFIMPSVIFNSHRNNLDIVAVGRYLPTIKELFSIIITFLLTVFAWIFFRATDVTHAFRYIGHIGSGIRLHPGAILNATFWSPYVTLLLLIGFFMSLEWIGREHDYAIKKIGLKWARPARWLFYMSIAVAIFLFQGKQHTFIYFQF